MSKQVLVIMVITFLSKVLGLVRESVLIHFYGFTAITDAFVVALSIPFLAISMVGTAITTAFIPRYNSIYKEEGKLGADRYSSNIFNITLLISLGVFFVFQIFSPQISKILASGFDEATLELSSKFIRIASFSVLFVAVPGVFKGYLVNNGYVSVTESSSLVLNVFLISAIVFSVYFRPSLLIVVSTLGYLLQYIFFLPSLRALNYRYSFALDFKDEEIKRFAKLFFPLILGVAVFEFNLIIDKNLASRIADGAISILNFASMIQGVFLSIIVASINTVTYPIMSRLAIEEKTDELNQVYRSAIVFATILIIPALFGIYFYSNAIISLMFPLKSISASEIQAIAEALVFYSFGIYTYSIREISSRVLYSHNDTSTPIKISAGMLIVNLVTSILLSKVMGINGIALGTSIAGGYGLVRTLTAMRSRTANLELAYIVKSTLKLIVASVVMIMVSLPIYRMLIDRLALLPLVAVTAVICLLTYAIMLLVLKVEEARLLVSYFKKSR